MSTLATNTAGNLAVDMKFCTDCGEQIKRRAVVCPHCGVAQASDTPTEEGRSRLAAGLIALFLGGLGIHKFYLGRTLWGVVYLLFCWTFIPVILGLIEGIVYLATSDRKFNAKYNVISQDAVV